MIIFIFLEQSKDCTTVTENDRESEPGLWAEYCFLSLKTELSTCCNWMPGDIKKKNTCQSYETSELGKNDIQMLCESTGLIRYGILGISP